MKDVEEWNVNHVKRMRIFQLKRIGQIDIRLARKGIKTDIWIETM